MVDEAQMCPVCSSFQILLVMVLDSMAWTSLRFWNDPLETLSHEEFLAFFDMLDTVCSALSSCADGFLFPSIQEGMCEKLGSNQCTLPSSTQANSHQRMLISLLRIFIHTVRNNLAPIFLDSIYNRTYISRNNNLEDISVIGEMAYSLFVLLYHIFIEEGEYENED